MRIISRIAVTFNFGGKCEDATWELVNSATFIEGSTIGPTFARPEDVPAIGGIPLRDRREQFIFPQWLPPDGADRATGLSVLWRRVITTIS